MKNLKKKFRIFFKKTWPFILAILIVCAFFWKTCLLKQIPFPGDFVVGIYHPWLDYKWGFSVGVPVKNPITADVPSFIYPMQTFAVDLMKNGEWPLWNPHILAGSPLLANLQSAPLSPTVFVYFIFDKITAWSVQVILQHILVIVFTYLLLQRWKVSKFGSLVGGTIFAFSGFNLIWSQWNGHTLTAAFIPLLLFFEDRWLKKGKFLDGFGIALALCFQILSGYPQIVLYTAVAAGALWLVRIWGDKKWLLKTVFLGLFMALGFGLSGPQLLPGVELLSLSQWTAEPHPFEWAFLPWKKVITFLAPDFFGNHSTGNYWGPQDYTSNTGFVGVVALVLAGLSLKLFKKKKEIVFSLLLLILTLILTFPTPLSVFLWKNNLFGMRSSSAHRGLVLFNLSIALLAGFGIDSMRKKFKFGWKYLVIPLVILAAYWIYALSLGETIIRGIPISKVALRNLVIPTGVVGLTTMLLRATSKWKKLSVWGTILIFLLLVLELFRFGWKFTPFSTRDLVFPETPVLSFLTSQEKPFRVTSNRVIPVNLAMPYGLESLEGYETMRPAMSSQFLATLNRNSVMASPAGRYGIIDNDTSHLLDLVNTKYYLTIKRNKEGAPDISGQIPDRFKTDRFKLAFEDKSVAVLESKTALPRAFMVYDWEIMEEDEEILGRLLDPEFSMKSRIILEKAPPEISKTAQVLQPSIVEYTKYSGQESIIDITTEEDGMLFVSDTFYPGWKAFVDGEEVEIYRANFAFRAIAVPKGEHNVRFIYQPESFFNGLRLSALSLFSLLGIYLLISRQKKSYT